MWICSFRNSSISIVVVPCNQAQIWQGKIFKLIWWNSLALLQRKELLLFESQITICSTIMWMSLLHFFPLWYEMLVVTCGSVSCYESLCCELSLIHFFFPESLPVVISVCVFFSFHTTLAQSQDWSKNFLYSPLSCLNGKNRFWCC